MAKHECVIVTVTMTGATSAPLNGGRVPGKQLETLYADGWSCVAVLQPAQHGQPENNWRAVILLEREVQ